MEHSLKTLPQQGMKKETYEFISQKNKDPIVERRRCTRTGEEFAIYQSDIDLLDRVSPTIGGQKFSFPLPTLSPESRIRRMMMFRNERKLYKRKCSKTGKGIVALYPEQYEGQVYAPDLRWSDNRDPLAFGKDYVPGKFYDDLKDLFRQVPFLNLFAFSNENSDYTNGSQGNKNCYMIFASDHDEDCYYSYSIFNCKNIVDAYGCKKCENCYQVIDTINSMKVAYAQKVEDSFNVLFSYHIKSCKNVFLCVGLKDKEYCFKNEYVGKERWESEIVPMIKDMFANNKIAEYEAMLHDMKKGSIVQNMNIINTQNGIGDFINNSKNAIYCFETHNAEDVKGVIHANGCKDIMGGYVVVDDSQKVHEGIGCGANYSTATVWNSRNPTRNTYFSNFIMNVENMMGVVSCRGKEHCILNKQYTKDEREQKAKQIAQELLDQGKRGEFFDSDFSPFPYNDTVAMEYHPVTPGQLTILQPEKFISDAILNLGGEEKIKIKRRTKETEINIPEGIKTIKASEIPTDISKVTNDILEKAIVCEVSGRIFKLSAPELEFYRRNGFPIPTKHPDVRHEERFNKRPGRNLSLRTCDKCGVETLSVYPQDSDFKVYCAECYNKEIYS